MSVPLTINGVTFQFPQQFDTNWGPAVTNWATAVTNGLLQKTGGLFTLLSDINFGPNFGLGAIYYKSLTANISTVGILRLANIDTIGWRNFANTGNLLLGVDATDSLTFNGVPVSPQPLGPGSNPTFNSLTLTTPLTVPNGGTGDTSFGAFSVLCGGITSTAALQNVSGVGAAGQALTSNGAGLLPTWQNVAGSGTVNTGVAGQLAYYAASTNVISGTPVLTLSGSDLLAGGLIDAVGIRSTGISVAATGSGVELLFSAGIGIIDAVTRPAATPLQLSVRGNPLSLEGNGGSTLSLNTLATFNTVVDMTSHKITNVTQATVTGDAVSFPLNEIQTAGFVSGAGTGATASDSITVTVVTGQWILVHGYITLSGTTTGTGSFSFSANIDAAGLNTLPGGQNDFGIFTNATTAITASLPLSTVFQAPSTGALTIRSRYTLFTGTGVTLSRHSLNVVVIKV